MTKRKRPANPATYAVAVLTETELGSIAEQLAGRFADRRFGSIHVLSVDAEVITDVDDYLAVQLNLHLDDPDGETWPPDDVTDLYRAARAEAQTFPEPFPVYLEFRPRTEVEQETDDEV